MMRWVAFLPLVILVLVAIWAGIDAWLEDRRGGLSIEEMRRRGFM